MNKIKAASISVLLLSIVLAFLSNYISNQNRQDLNFLETVNTKKAFTQEVSKNIFYMYKHDNKSTKYLDEIIKKFIHNLNLENTQKSFSNKEIEAKNKKILKLWNKFYLLVENFRNQTKIKTAYSSIIIEKIVNNIYTTNIELLIEFDKLIKLHKKYLDKRLDTYIFIQYTLFAVLMILLIYLITKLKDIFLLIQKFISTSKQIIKHSSIKDLKPIKQTSKHTEVIEATNNFNFLLERINNNIKNSTKHMEYTYKSLENVEKDIENMLDLLFEMNDTKNENFNKKEDTIIQSLEELTNSKHKLQNLKKELEKLL